MELIAIITADVWQWTPFMFVILLAGLAAIPPHLYEAAELDGVGAIQAFRYVTLPQLAPIICSRSPFACSTRSSCST